MGDVRAVHMATFETAVIAGDYLHQPVSCAVKPWKAIVWNSLQYTNSQSAIDVRLTDLDDPDGEVQFAVMQSLGNLTNRPGGRGSCNCCLFDSEFQGGSRT